MLAELDPIASVKRSSFGQNVIVLSRKSFAAYVIPMGVWFVVWIISMAVSSFLGILILLVGVYMVLYLRSYILYMDNEGVWVFRGVFPWQIGIYGVRWVNFQQGLFYPRFTSWVSNSFSLSVRERRTQKMEIELNHMYKGNEAVTRINEAAVSAIPRT